MSGSFPDSPVPGHLPPPTGQLPAPLPPPVLPPPEAPAGAEVPEDTPHRFRTLVVVLTLINTVFAALLAGAQVDASARADVANRDSQALAVTISATLVAVGIESEYQLGVLAQMLTEDQRSIGLNYSALLRSQQGDDVGARQLVAQAQVAAKRAERARSLSVFYQDPRYRPAGDGLPNSQRYLEDMNAEAQSLLTRQNAASDAYNLWSSKADKYVAVLTVVAVAFVLLGIGQATRRTRLIFASVAAALMVISAGWAATIFVMA